MIYEAGKFQPGFPFFARHMRLPLAWIARRASPARYRNLRGTPSLAPNGRQVMSSTAEKVADIIASPQ